MSADRGQTGTTGTGVEADEVFSVEQHGINLIPLDDRHGRPSELFWVWMGANLIFTYVIFGVLAFSFGVSFWGAVAALVLGNLFFALVGLIGMTGPRTGSPTLVASRAAFGPLGNIPACFLAWLTVVGFGVVNAVVGTLSLSQLAREVGLPGGNVVQAACLALVLVVTFAVAVWGHATVAFLERWLAYGLGVGALLLAFFVLPDADTGATAPLAADNAFGAWLLAFFIFLSGPFSYLSVPADYTRYLRPDTRPGPIVWWTALGAAIPAVLLGLVGIAAATATDVTDPVAGLAELVPGWFLVPFLAIVVGGSITNNILGLYSSALQLQVMGVPLPRSRNAVIVAVLITIGAVYAVFVSDFTTALTNFLSLMVIWIAPWGAIYLVDVYLRRNRYDAPALHQVGGGPYWYSRGLNPRALAALVLGVLAGCAFSNSALFRGPLVGIVSGGDLSIFAGLVVGGVAYYLLMRPVIQRSNAAIPGDAEAGTPKDETVEGWHEVKEGNE